MNSYPGNAMKTIKNLMFVAFAATSIAACQKEVVNYNDNDIASKGDIVTFTGNVNGAETKTAIYYQDGVSNFPTLFTTADVIAVNGVKSKAEILNDSTMVMEYKEGVSVSKDQQSITFDVEGVTAPYYAVTGTHFKKPENYTDGSYIINVSGTGAPQKYRTVAGGEYISFHSSSDILAAYSETESLKFKHLTTYYAITINSENSTVKNNIKKVYIRQGDGANIAGTWSLNFEEVEGDFIPTLEPRALTAAIAFDCEGGLAQGTTMIVGLPSYNYASGLIFTLEDVNGNFDSYLVKPEKTHHAKDGGKIIPFNPPFKPVSGSIATAEQWNAFAEIMNSTEKKEEDLARFIVDGHVKISADIKGTIKSIKELPANIIINGNGKTITRANATAALFGTVAGEVRNLTLAGTLTLADEGAPFVDILDGGKISGCTNNMTILFDKADHAYVAGIVKKMTGGTIENCVNNGSISVKLGNEKGNKNVGIGGIVGQIDGSDAEMLVKDCLNKAAITFAPVIASKDDGSAVCGVGGIAGWMRRASSFTFDNCDNEGDVTYSAKNVTSLEGAATFPICVGGIVGVGSNYKGSVIDDVANGINVSISDCDNTGIVYNCGVVNTTNKASGKRAFTGGLVGFLLGQEGKRAAISSCTNTGAVYSYDLTGDGASTAPYPSSVAGGLVGFGGYLDMDNCTVNCEIGCQKRVMMSLGGVIGFTVRPFTLTDSKVHISGYYHRISNYQNNRAIVASVPTYYGDNTNNPMTITPDITGSMISNCNVGGHINTTESALSLKNGIKSDDLSGSEWTVMLFNSQNKVNEGMVCGQGFVLADGDLTVENVTYWNGK